MIFINFLGFRGYPGGEGGEGGVKGVKTPENGPRNPSSRGGYPFQGGEGGVGGVSGVKTRKIMFFSISGGKSRKSWFFVFFWVCQIPTEFPPIYVGGSDSISVSNRTQTPSKMGLGMGEKIPDTFYFFLPPLGHRIIPIMFLTSWCDTKCSTSCHSLVVNVRSPFASLRGAIMRSQFPSISGSWYPP